MDYVANVGRTVVSASVSRSVRVALFGLLTFGVGFNPERARAEGLGLSVGLGGVSAGVGVGGGRSGVGVGVGASVGGARAGVGVGVGGGRTGTGVGVGIGVGLEGNGTTTQPTTGARTRRGVAVLAAAGENVPERLPRSKFRCGRSGNTVAFNGYPVMDKGGQMIGWVEGAELSNELEIAQVRMQTMSRSCVSISGGSFAFQDEALWSSVHASDLN